MTTDSVQKREHFALYAGKKQGSRGQYLDSGTSGKGSSVAALSATDQLADPRPGFDSLSVGPFSKDCGNSNVLLRSVTLTLDLRANAPTPATFALAGGALIGLASLGGRHCRWRR